MENLERTGKRDWNVGDILLLKGNIREGITYLLDEEFSIIEVIAELDFSTSKHQKIFNTLFKYNIKQNDTKN